MCEKQSARMPSLLRGMGIHFCDSSAHTDPFPFIIVIAVSMTRCHAASSKVHLHSSVRFSPCPVASFGSKLPWTLPLAFHPTVTSDAERDWRQPWILGWERLCSTQHKRPQVAHAIRQLIEVVEEITDEDELVLLGSQVVCERIPGTMDDAFPHALLREDR